MKKITCLLLSLLLMLTVLTSCDALTTILGSLESTTVEPQVTTTEPAVTTTEPEVTTTEPEVTTTEPEVTTTEPEVTTTEPEITTTEPEVTTTEPEVTTTEPEDIPSAPEINYGSFINPVTTTYAYNVCANLANGESSADAFYVEGTVTEIGKTGSYYQNVYFTDGTTEMLIYTIDMGDGINGFKVGDTITAYGYIKNYNGIIEMATYKSVYVYVVKIEAASGDTAEHLYTDFTSDEKALFDDYFGLVIPFIANDEYYVEESYESGTSYVSFYTFGNTQAEFDAYLSLYSSYQFDGTDIDEYGDTWYMYSKDDVSIDISYYYYEGAYVVDIYVYILEEGEDVTDPSNHLYTDFTADEKALFHSSVGLVIPFIPNSEYYVEEYEDWGETGISFYTFGNTQAEFAAYRSLFSSYTYDGSEADEDGDMWYFYSKGDVCVDMSFYYYEGDYVVDVYIYVSVDDGDGDDDWGDDDWGDDDWGDTEEDLITNDGKGLPEDNDGVYDVDFTKGQYVQNVTDQGYYIDGCPTIGNPAVLVIPVEFKDITAQSKGYSIQNIKEIFYGKTTSYYSVYDYFLTSSYNQLSLNITILDSWFCPKNNSSYYENATYDYSGEEIAIGDQLIMDEALAYLATVMDLSAFDSDNNGIIDAIVMVNTLEIGEDDFHWAYRYWNLYTDDEEYYYEYDGVSANDYVWIAYDFMFEAYDENGNTNYDNSNPLNPYTFIHEFSHILGADDYYDTEYQEHPLGGFDMMDGMIGDHNPYTKFNFGWITSSKLIVTNGTVTVNLEAFAKNGDTIILANNWDETLGAYQEYYVIMYYTMTELNSGIGGFFARDGIVVYHINASLYIEQYGDEPLYNVYNTNTSSGDYGTKDNLIEFVKSGEGNYTYTVGDTLPTTADDFGNELGYTFIVDAITEEFATITFTKK